MYAGVGNGALHIGFSYSAVVASLGFGTKLNM